MTTINSKNVSDFVVYESLIGSKAYGLDTEESDDDVRGIFVAPTKLFWRVDTQPPETIEIREGADRVYWEVGKFVSLAIKANPTILEVLYTDTVLKNSWIGLRLRGIRDCFLSKLVTSTYGGYATAQMKRLQQRATTEEPNWKHAQNMIRLLLCGVCVLQNGFVPVRMGINRDYLLEIRNGVHSLNVVVNEADVLRRVLDESAKVTKLPDKPDYGPINALMYDIRTMHRDDLTLPPVSEEC